MTLEEPRSLGDPAKEHTLKRIKPSEVHPDRFKNATEPLHYTALYLLSLYLLRIYLSPSKYLPSKVSNLVSSLPSSWELGMLVGRWEETPLILVPAHRGYSLVAELPTCTHRHVRTSLRFRAGTAALASAPVLPT